MRRLPRAATPRIGWSRPWTRPWVRPRPAFASGAPRIGWWRPPRRRPWRWWRDGAWESLPWGPGWWDYAPWDLPGSPVDGDLPTTIWDDPLTDPLARTPLLPWEDEGQRPASEVGTPRSSDLTEEEADLSVIGLSDDRVQEIETTRFPWNTLVHLCRDFGNGFCAGCSGVLVSPRRVLTAAHCIWSLRRRAAPFRIVVAPGRRDRNTMPYGTIEARRFWVPRGFITGPDRAAWDWAIVELPRPFPGIHHFMRIRALPDRVLARIAERGRVTVAGYPSDRPVGTLWRHAERLVRFGPRQLIHSVDTCPGHSGSPIMARLGPDVAIIGVHTAGVLDSEGRSHGCKRGTVLAPPGSVNSGVRVTPSLLAALADPGTPRTGPGAMVALP